MYLFVCTLTNSREDSLVNFSIQNLKHLLIECGENTNSIRYALVIIRLQLILHSAFTPRSSHLTTHITPPRNDQDSKSRLLAVVTNIIGLNSGTYSIISNSRSSSHAHHCPALVEDGLQMVNWSTSNLFFPAALHHDEPQLTKARLFISELSNRHEARNGVWERSTLN